MTTYAPAYRATLYKRRSDDIGETTVLAATSPHTDDFKVATMSGVSGFQPYLAMPDNGRRGTVDPLTRRWTQGRMTLRLLDKGTDSTDRLKRWVTAFLGDSKGRCQLLGCKVAVQESLDAGATWGPFWVGRVQDVTLEDPLWYTLTLDDLSDDLNVWCFGERPHSSISYAAEPQLLPVGLAAAYGAIPAASTLAGTIGAPTVARGTSYRTITLTSASQAATDNLATRDLFRHLYYPAATTNDPYAGITGAVGGLGYLRPRPSIRCRFSCASPSVTNKECEVLNVRLQQRSDGTYRVTEIMVRPLLKEDGVTTATADPYYQALDTGTIANGTSLTGISLRVDYRRIATASDAYTDETPLVIGDVHVLDLFRDLCDGDFSALYRDGQTIPSGKSAGDQLYPISLDTAGSSAWDVLRNPTTKNAFPTVRAKVTKRMKRFDVLEQLGQQFGFGYRLQPTAAATCRIVPIDFRLPTSGDLAGIPTLTEADLDTTAAIGWSTDRASAITEFVVQTYTDFQLGLASVTEMPSWFRFPEIPPARIETVGNASVFPDYGRAVDLGQRTHTVDGWAMRGTANSTDVVENVHSLAYVQGLAERCAAHFRTYFENGATMLTFRALRTANTTSLWPGDWCYVNADMTPDPATNLRGGTRLVQVVDRSEEGPCIAFKAIDAGAGASASAPTIGSPSQRTSDTYHGVTVTVTVNASSEPVEVQYAVKATSYGTSAPADTDTGWVQWKTIAATTTLDILNLPSNSRVFVRARSLPDPKATNGTPKLPSAWAYPSGTKYVDTAALTAPSSVTTSPGVILTTSTVTASWTNADTSHALEYGTETGGTDTLRGVLPPGSVGPVTLNTWLAASTTYTVWARLRDELGGYSSKGRSASFTTPGGFTGPTLTAPTLAVLVG